jgi:hypothetical protein
MSWRPFFNIAVYEKFWFLNFPKVESGLDELDDSAVILNAAVCYFYNYFGEFLFIKVIRFDLGIFLP